MNRSLTLSMIGPTLRSTGLKCCFHDLRFTHVSSYLFRQMAVSAKIICVMRWVKLPKMLSNKLSGFKECFTSLATEHVECSVVFADKFSPCLLSGPQMTWLVVSPLKPECAHGILIPIKLEFSCVGIMMLKWTAVRNFTRPLINELKFFQIPVCDVPGDGKCCRNMLIFYSFCTCSMQSNVVQDSAEKSVRTLRMFFYGEFFKNRHCGVLILLSFCVWFNIKNTLYSSGF